MANIRRELPIAGDPAPGIHSAWLTALSSIDNTSFPDELPSDRGYILPDPNVFINLATKAIRIPQLYQYLQLRPTLIQRLGVTSSIIPIAVPLAGRIWRQVLALNADGFTAALTPTSNSKMTKAADDKYHAALFLSSCVEATKETSATTLATILSTTPVFRGEEISIDTLSDLSLVKQVLWELAELNFRIELGALDQRPAETSIPVKLGQTSSTVFAHHQHPVPSWSLTTKRPVWVLHQATFMYAFHNSSSSRSSSRPGSLPYLQSSLRISSPRLLAPLLPSNQPYIIFTPLLSLNIMVATQLFPASCRRCLRSLLLRVI